MKALAISGSPREHGNTALLLERLLQPLAAAGIATELVSLAGRSVKPCTACNGCARSRDRRCVMADDDFHDIFDRMLAADILVVGSPVYFGSATPNLMALLDRAGYVARANGNLLSRKIGGPVVVARRAGHNFTLAQLVCWYLINDFVVPGSSYWMIAFGRAPGEVANDQEGLSTLARFAENLIWLSGKIGG
jgi:multimeric flavodoxin WrbA